MGSTIKVDETLTPNHAFFGKKPPWVEKPTFFGMEPESFFCGFGGLPNPGVWVGVLDSALSVCIRTGELSIKQILHYLFILADDVGVYIRPQFVDDFIHELEFSLKKYGLQIRDYNPETQAGVNQGCCDSFEFLGFDIKHGVTVPKSGEAIRSDNMARL